LLKQSIETADDVRGLLIAAAGHSDPPGRDNGWQSGVISGTTKPQRGKIALMSLSSDRIVSLQASVSGFREVGVRNDSRVKVVNHTATVSEVDFDGETFLLFQTDLKPESSNPPLSDKVFPKSVWQAPPGCSPKSPLALFTICSDTVIWFNFHTTMLLIRDIDSMIRDSPFLGHPRDLIESLHGFLMSGCESSFLEAAGRLLYCCCFPLSSLLSDIECLTPRTSPTHLGLLGTMRYLPDRRLVKQSEISGECPIPVRVLRLAQSSPIN
jgi:hypothetical protein